jgi:predicted permease
MIRELLRKFAWWLQRRRKEDELREELQFHFEEELDERRADGLSIDRARTAAYRDLGNATLLREEARTLWTWTLVEGLAQDVRYAVRTMFKDWSFTALVALSLAFGIGANTAIYSFMDAILFQSLPVADPGSLVVMNWRSKPFAFGSNASKSEFVLHSIDGTFYPDQGGTTGAIFPFAAFERLQQVSEPVFSSIFAYFTAGDLNVVVDRGAEISKGLYVSGGFFGALGLSPAAGRFIVADDDRAGAVPVAVVSFGYSQRRFGGAAEAIGRPIVINNVVFTVVGVAPPEFWGVNPGEAPQLYLPLHTSLRIDPDDTQRYTDENYYWLGMMGRLPPDVTLAQAEAGLAAPFAEWVASTATTDGERANLPMLRLQEGAGGLDALRRQYSKPLFVLLAMVGLILAIACANTANLLLARAAARRREMAVRLSIGASRFRVMRQLLTESVLLASLGGALGIFVALAGMRVLMRLLSNGRDGFVLNAALNWHVLGATLALSLLCGILFGLAPAVQSARPHLMPALRDVGAGDRRGRLHTGIPRFGLTRVLVVAQVALSLLLLVAAGLFIRTLSNLHSVHFGFDREHVLLFDVDAPKAGRPPAQVVDYYADLQRRLAAVSGVRDVTLSHASLLKAGRGHPVSVDGVPAQGTRILYTGPAFFTTMRIPMVRGREIREHDRSGALPVAVVSESFAKRYLQDRDPIGRRVRVGGSLPMELEIVGVAATARYGRLKDDIPPVLYIPYAQIVPARQGPMTYALRTDGEPLRYAEVVRQIVQQTDSRVPVTNVRTQVQDIDQTINQEVVFARLCTMFALLALVIACVGLYGTTSYSVARRTREIGIRMALGARRATVVWAVLREVCLLTVVGIVISVPVALAAARAVASFLFGVQPNDPRAIVGAAVVLLTAALLAGYAPARRASRVDPMIALRHE